MKEISSEVIVLVEYITRDEFRGFTADLSLQESSTLRKNAESRSPQGSTFLSHSSKDDDIVTGATRILENHGARVYIDKSLTEKEVE